MYRIIEYFRDIFLFAGLDQTALEKISKKAEKRIYDNGSTVVHEGDIGNSIYFVTEGKLKVVLVGDDSKEYIIRLLNVGDYFGELSLFDDVKRASHVKAISKCELLMFHKEVFIEIIDEYPTISRNLMKRAFKMVGNTNEHVGSLLFVPADQRIMKTIINLAKNAPENEMGLKIIKKISVTDIAEMTGVVRPTASKIINDLKRRGYIDINKKTITLLRNDLEGLCR
jgi:CRP-like cAMP-binding protein